MNFGKDSKIVRLIQQKTKMKREDIFDVLAALPEAMADVLIESDLTEDNMLHLGFISIGFQTKKIRQPEITFQMVKKFKHHLTERKFRRDTPLAQLLYSQLPAHLKEKMDKKKSRVKERQDHSLSE